MIPYALLVFVCWASESVTMSPLVIKLTRSCQKTQFVEGARCLRGTLHLLAWQLPWLIIRLDIQAVCVWHNG
ncbi:hypothetical protein BJV82DRAFT_610275 [Fennellomyces sp. T-0311]|nr:hypothetical protein BJV82DRAFT_610275 [Fennellomyces sp. T-0311]